MGKISIQIKNIEYKQKQILTKAHKDALRDEERILKDYSASQEIQKDIKTLKNSSSPQNYHLKNKSWDFSKIHSNTYQKRVKALKNEILRINIKLKKRERVEFLEKWIRETKDWLKKIEKEVESKIVSNSASSNMITTRNNLSVNNIKEELKLSISKYTSVNNKRSKGTLITFNSNITYQGGQQNINKIMVPKLKIDKIKTNFNSKYHNLIV